MKKVHFESNSKVVEVLYLIVESDNFLVPSIQSDNAKELAKELLHKVRGE